MGAAEWGVVSYYLYIGNNDILHFRHIAPPRPAASSSASGISSNRPIHEATGRRGVAQRSDTAHQFPSYRGAPRGALKAAACGKPPTNPVPGGEAGRGGADTPVTVLKVNVRARAVSDGAYYLPPYLRKRSGMVGYRRGYRSAPLRLFPWKPLAPRLPAKIRKKNNLRALYIISVCLSAPREVSSHRAARHLQYLQDLQGRGRDITHDVHTIDTPPIRGTPRRLARRGRTPPPCWHAVVAQRLIPAAPPPPSLSTCSIPFRERGGGG